MKRERRTRLNQVRRNLVEQYHALSDIMVNVNDQCDGLVIDLDSDAELATAFEKISDAINCINRELGIPNDS